MNFLFLMDPLETVVMEKDTSFILMVGAHRKGHKVFFLPNGGIDNKHGELQFRVIEVVPQQIKDKPFVIGKNVTLSEDQVDAIFIRTDPPFDSRYLMDTWMLELAHKRIAIVNNPTGVRTVNEKVWATQFDQLVPRTVISRNKAVLKEFIVEVKKCVAKPTSGHGGQGVFIIDEGSKNTNVILETLSDEWRHEIIVQEYLPDAQTGDKRIILLNGEPIGAVLRVHGKDDHRNNFFAGGTPHPTEITERDKEIIDTLKPHLQRLGLYFVGIDVIGGKLVEVNVTSPTCLQEMNRLYKKTLEDEVITFVEKLVDQQ